MIAICFSALAGCRPECEQPLSAFCAENACKTFDETVAGARPALDGGCAGFTVTQCNGVRIVGYSGHVGTSLSFSDAGQLIGVHQLNDVVWDCGSSVRDFGEQPECSERTSTTYCPQ